MKNSIEAFNALHGQIVSRQYLENLSTQGFNEQQFEVSTRLNSLLSKFPEAETFEIDITTPAVFNGSAHGGLGAVKKLKPKYASVIATLKKDKEYISHKKVTGKFKGEKQTNIHIYTQKSFVSKSNQFGLESFSDEKGHGLLVPVSTEVKKKDEIDYNDIYKGLSAPHHEGIAKEALNTCGRLLKGYKFDKGGSIIKVAVKTKEVKQNTEKQHPKLNKYLEKVVSLKHSLEIEEAKISALNEKMKAETDYNIKSKLWEEKSALQGIISILTFKQTKNINAISAISSGGDVIEITDKKGKTHSDIADFRNVSTENFIFNPETILEEAPPPYLPLFNEKNLEGRGFVFDAIKFEKDSYLAATKSHNEREATEYVVITLDQLVLISDYYLTRLKALNVQKAIEQTKRGLEHWDNMPEDKKIRFFTVNSNRALYNGLPAKTKKVITLEKYSDLTWQEKEKIYKFYKRYNSKRITSKLDDSHMFTSLHAMYERFINPKATQPKPRIANSEVFAYWVQFREDLKFKLIDIDIQRSDYSETRSKGMETSFGDSNLNDSLLNKYGILVKRQNGDVISPNQIQDIEISFDKVLTVFGDIKPICKSYGLKVSHTGNTLVYARKALGIFSPKHKAIAASAKYSRLDFTTTIAHELAHFLDYSLGQTTGKRYASDNFESSAGILASTFRKNLNGFKQKTPLSNYLNSTKECLARALEQHFAMQSYGNETLHFYNEMMGETAPNTKYVDDYAFVDLKTYNAIIKPLIETFLKEAISTKTKLAAPRHEGIAKEGLTDCGRLKPGYKFEKGGNVIKIENENPFEKFEAIVKKSKNIDEAFDEVKKIKNVPKNIAEAFRKKYDSDNNLSAKQAFTKFYNEIKGIENQPKAKENTKKTVKTIEQKVIDAKAELTKMETSAKLREWAINNGMDNQSAFPRFKKALLKIGINYDDIKQVASKEKAKVIEDNANYELELYSDYKSGTNKFAITDADGNPLWYGVDFDQPETQPEGELNAAKKAVWLAYKIADLKAQKGIKLILNVDAQFLVYQDHAKQKGYELKRLADKYGIVLDTNWVPGKENPADAYTVKSGYMKWNDTPSNQLFNLLKPLHKKENPKGYNIKPKSIAVTTAINDILNLKKYNTLKPTQAKILYDIFKNDTNSIVEDESDFKKGILKNIDEKFAFVYVSSDEIELNNLGKEFIESVNNRLESLKNQKNNYALFDGLAMPCENLTNKQITEAANESTDKVRKMSRHEFSNIPDAAIDEIKNWNVISKSPYSHSYYNDICKSWDFTAENSFRISDHWNFFSRGTIHAKTDNPVKNNTWVLAQYKNGIYNIIKDYGVASVTQMAKRQFDYDAEYAINIFKKDINIQKNLQETYLKILKIGINTQDYNFLKKDGTTNMAQAKKFNTDVSEKFIKTKKPIVIIEKGIYSGSGSRTKRIGSEKHEGKLINITKEFATINTNKETLTGKDFEFKNKDIGRDFLVLAESSDTAQRINKMFAELGIKNAKKELNNVGLKQPIIKKLGTVLIDVSAPTPAVVVNEGTIAAVPLDAPKPEIQEPEKPIQHKPRHKNNLVQGITAAKRAAANSMYFNLDGPLINFLGKLERKTTHSLVITLDAPPGAGKTRSLFQMINTVANAGLTSIFFSLEEHPESKLFSEKTQLYISPKNESLIDVVGDLPETYEEFIKIIEAYDFTGIDSWNKAFEKYGVDFDNDLRKRVNGKIIFAIFQRTQDGKMRGGAKAAFDGDIILEVVKADDFRNSYLQARKNRYQDIPLNQIGYNFYHQQTMNPEQQLARYSMPNEMII